MIARIKIWGVLTLGIALVGSTAAAQTNVDRVQRRNGIDSGTITAMTPLGISISKSGVSSKIPAEDIRSIQFAGEPREFNYVRTQIGRGRYDVALERLRQIDRAAISRDEVLQELDFAAALCQAHLALAGKGEKQTAIVALDEFMKTHRTSYHVPEVIELHGDLYLAKGDLAAARGKYETLAKAQTPYYKARSALLVGKLLQDQNQHAEAIGQFETAITEAGTTALARDTRTAAVLGRAVSLAATGKLAEATAIITQKLQATSTDEPTELARGYNALGACYLAAGDVRAARDAYLHVDLLFDSTGSEHAEALFQLSDIWQQLRQPTRAQEAQQRLLDDYSLSRWAGALN